MAQCSNCSHFHPLMDRNNFGRCSLDGCIPCAANRACKRYEYGGNFDDELDEYLFENHQVKSGCSSSIEGLKYQIAREVAERMIEKFDIDIQYISQEERRKRMDEMYSINLIK